MGMKSYLLYNTDLLHFLKQHLTAFVDLVYWSGLENGTLHFIFIFP